MSEREVFVRRFHEAHPGITARAAALDASYARLAAALPSGGRVLDLACGDGPLLGRLGPRAIGLDLARAELGSRPRVVQGRAQALPFADAVFDAVGCHLAFMLFDDVERVVAELGRVLVPGGAFVAVLGGGPTGDGDDVFHRFLDVVGRHRPSAPRLGDRRARSEQGWCELFAGWRPPRFERHVVPAGGRFDDAWAFLGASYELDGLDAPAIRDELREISGAEVRCDVVTWLARVTR